MIRRILIAGAGGGVGFLLWYTLVAAHVSGSSSDYEMKLAIGTLIGCVIGCGAIVMVLGEKSGLIPSQEQVEAKAKPVSLFSTNDSGPQAGPPAPQPPLARVTPSTEPDCPVSEEEIQARIDHIRANRPVPEWVYLGGGSDDLLTLQATPGAKPVMLLFSSKYAAHDYIRAIKAPMEVKQIRTSQLPEMARSWISQDVNRVILNRCPRCAEAVQFGTKQLLTVEGYAVIWAADQATRWWRGEIQCAWMNEHCKDNSLTKARQALENIRDHIDCSIPYVHQLIAFFADAENDTAAKEAACQALELFPTEFRWSPDYADDNKRGAELLATATVGLAINFPPFPGQ